MYYTKCITQNVHANKLNIFKVITFNEPGIKALLIRKIECTFDDSRLNYVLVIRRIDRKSYMKCPNVYHCVWPIRYQVWYIVGKNYWL